MRGATGGQPATHLESAPAPFPITIDRGALAGVLIAIGFLIVWTRLHPDWWRCFLGRG